MIADMKNEGKDSISGKDKDGKKEETKEENGKKLDTDKKSGTSYFLMSDSMTRL